MTNYDKWLQAKQRELDGMTPLLLAVKIDRRDTKRDECSLIEDFGEPVERCREHCDEDGCIGCIKQWLEKEVVQ